jgi:hypothetical protein
LSRRRVISIVKDKRDNYKEAYEIIVHTGIIATLFSAVLFFDIRGVCKGVVSEMLGIWLINRESSATI